MRFEDLKMMSIGGNCANLFILGKDRIRGPVDNLFGRKDRICFKSLFEKTFLDEFKSIVPETRPRKPGYNGDSDKMYLYKSYAVVHNNPLDKGYFKELEKRYNNFLDFYSHIQEPNFYFLYSLNQEVSRWINEFTNKGLLKREIQYLKERNILNKVIFIGTKQLNFKGCWNYYSKTFKQDFPELLYIEIPDLNQSDHFTFFKNEMTRLLNLES